jgi:hypothetical protein
MTTALVALSTLAFIGVGGTVGVRLLLLARRTGGLPERALGIGFTLVAGLGYPLTLVAMVPALPEGVAHAAFVAAMMATSVGSAAIFVFTRTAFRPEARWALAAVVAAALLLLGLGGLAIVQSIGQPQAAWVRTDLAAQLRQQLMGLAYAWTAVEGFLQWRAGRKRQALGLADAAVVNRFALWAIAGVGASSGSLVIGLALAMGLIPTDAAWARLGIGIGGLVASVAVGLAFMPPRRYAAWVSGRSEAPGTSPST